MVRLKIKVSSRCYFFGVYRLCTTSKPSARAVNFHPRIKKRFGETSGVFTVG